MKFQINIGNRIIILQALFRKKRNSEYVEGYTNRCKDGKYVIFLDYDRVPIEWIMEEIKQLQEIYEIGDFYIFQSSKESYHAVCLDKVALTEYLSILHNSSVDTDYVDVPLYFGRKIWSLRLTDKNKNPIRFVGKAKGKFSELNQSSAHTTILNNLFDLKIELKYPDGEKELILARYPI